MTPEANDSPSQEQHLHEILEAYLQAVEAGQKPDRQELLARHPDLAGELAAFFADHDKLNRLAQPPLVPPHPAAREGPVPEAATGAFLPAEAPTLPPREAGTDAGRTGAYSPAQPPTLTSGESTAGPPLGTKVRYIGDYELLEELGRGGMGVVYQARQISLNRVVALKMILAGEHAGEKELARFRSEAEAVARLQHPNIVQIFEVSEHDGHPYFSLEFCAGGSLEKKINGTPWPARPAAQLVETLAQAMHTAHKAGIVHRDLKPANILLQLDEAGRMRDEKKPASASDSSFILHPSSFRPKITDFGLAKKLDDAAGQTASGAIMGTPSYMAPEQAGGNRRRSARPPMSMPWERSSTSC